MRITNNLKLSGSIVTCLLAWQVATCVAADEGIDSATIDQWSAPYRGWHYWPEHVVPAKPDIPGHNDMIGTDVPTVYQVPGDNKWYMSFVGFNGRGYQSFVAESDDLVHWKNYRLAMGFGPSNEFDHGGCVIGAFLYESYDIKAPRLLKKREGRFCTLYGAYPKQGGYELRPGYEGVACSDDGLTWRRAQDKPILSVFDTDCGQWEKSCIYQPWLVEHEGKFYNFYNAANGGIEQMGAAMSGDLLSWKRYAGNPVVRNRAGGYDSNFCSDGKVFRDSDHWVMFYFGVGRGGAHIMAAFSRDLEHWTAHPEPLYKAGGNPSGLDKQYAHKISLVWNPKNETYYLFYNAVPGLKTMTGGRGIGLITSKPIAPAAKAAKPVVQPEEVIHPPVRAQKPGADAEPRVVLKNDEATSRLSISVDGAEALVYRYGKDIGFTHFYPVWSPSGKAMTVEEAPPYPHHQSFWFADTVELEGHRKASFYGAIYSRIDKKDPKSPFKDQIVHAGFLPEKRIAPDQVETGMKQVWQIDQTVPVLDQDIRVRVVALGGGEYFLDLTYRVTAGYGDVKFVSDAVHYAWPYIRMHPQFSVDKGGKIVNSEGGINQKGTCSLEARWVDYSNTIDGVAEGLAIFSHSQNEYPHKWLTRDYGTFGPRRPDAQSGKPFTLAKGQSIERRVGVLVHKGDVAAGRVAERYAAYVAGKL
jgi:predicted GH43/DUF377 family glycosyl hydrolase